MKKQTKVSLLVLTATVTVVAVLAPVEKVPVGSGGWLQDDSGKWLQK